MTPKQELFCRAYLANGMNATQAAIAAGYSAKTASSIGEENLRKPEIAAAIAQQTKTVLTALDYGVERVLQQVARMAFYDPRKLYDAQGNLQPVHALDEETVAAIAGMEVCEDTPVPVDSEEPRPRSRTRKIRLADRGAALDKLMRYHSLYRDKAEVKHTFSEELAERLAKAQARTK